MKLRPAAAAVLVPALGLTLAACGGTPSVATSRAGDGQSAVLQSPDAVQPPESLETGVMPAPGREAAPPLPVPDASAPAAATGLAISRELSEEGRSLRVLVEGLPPAAEVVAIRLEGPAGQQVEAGEILTGTRMTGGSERPRVSLRGGSEDPLGVTLMLDVFSTRPEPVEERESALAWAFLPLPDPDAYAADPTAWRVAVTLQDEVGKRRQLTDETPWD